MVHLFFQTEGRDTGSPHLMTNHLVTVQIYDVPLGPGSGVPKAALPPLPHDH